MLEIINRCMFVCVGRLVFSQSLLSLDLIEDFLEHWDKAIKPDSPEEQVSFTQYFVGESFK